MIDGRYLWKSSYPLKTLPTRGYGTVLSYHLQNRIKNKILSANKKTNYKCTHQLFNKSATIQM